MVKKKFAIIVFMFVFITILSSCGNKEYVGTWYSIDKPESDSIIITEDDTYSWNSQGGSVSKAEDGILLIEQSGLGGSELFTLGEYDGNKALFGDNGDTYIQDYDKAVEYHNAAVEAELDYQNSIICGLYADSSDVLDVTFYSDRTYTLNKYSSGGLGGTKKTLSASEDGTWDTYQEGEYLCITVEGGSYGEAYLEGAWIQDYPLGYQGYGLHLGGGYSVVLSKMN